MYCFNKFLFSKIIQFFFSYVLIFSLEGYNDVESMTFSLKIYFCIGGLSVSLVVLAIYSPQKTKEIGHQFFIYLPPFLLAVSKRKGSHISTNDSLEFIFLLILVLRRVVIITSE